MGKIKVLDEKDFLVMANSRRMKAISALQVENSHPKLIFRGHQRRYARDLLRQDREYPGNH